MDYSYAQYQADKRLLKVPAGGVPVPSMMPRKLELAMAKADAADHAAIHAAHDRLLLVADSRNFPEPPPRRPPAGPVAPPTGGPANGEAPGPTSEEAARAKRDREDRAGWEAALATQADRHARRRGAWPDLAPPFKETSPQGA